jgi:hypothetical protein
VGFNRRKMEDQRRQAAEKQAAARRATDVQVLEDAERLITASNERQAKRMPMLFSPTIGAAIAARYWFISGGSGVTDFVAVSLIRFPSFSSSSQTNRFIACPIARKSSTSLGEI